MARTRDLKPGFFMNEELAQQPALGRLLFQGLWCHADRDGRLEDRPGRLKAQILPYDDCDVDELLDKLDSAGFVQRYESGGKGLIQIVTFAKHQAPHPREPSTGFPTPPARSHGKPGQETASRESPVPATYVSSLSSPSSDLTPIPSSAPSRAPDPSAGTTEHGEAVPAPSANRPDSHTVGRWFAKARSDAFSTAIGFHTPGFNRDTVDWLNAIPDELLPLLRPSMDRFFLHAKSGGKDWQDERFAKSVSWAFSAWRTRFPELAEEILGRTPKVTAKPKSTKQAGGYPYL